MPIVPLFFFELALLLLTWSGLDSVTGSVLSITCSALSLARQARTERDNESCLFVRAAGIDRFTYKTLSRQNLIRHYIRQVVLIPKKNIYFRPLIYKKWQTIQKQTQNDSRFVKNIQKKCQKKYNNIYFFIFQGIVARDLDHTDAVATVTAGGVGQSYANIRLKSERGSGLNYQLEIYV